MTKASMISLIVAINLPIVNNWNPKNIISNLVMHPPIPIHVTRIIKLISSLNKAKENDHA